MIHCLFVLTNRENPVLSDWISTWIRAYLNHFYYIRWIRRLSR